MRARKPVLVILGVATAAASAVLAPVVSASDADSGPSVVAAVPPGYYDAADGKSGTDLHTALHDIVDDHDTLSYSQVWDALKVIDEDPANPANVLLIYSGESMSENANGGGADQWNREHTWAKSHGDFGTSAGPGTDLHHLRPSKVGVNSTRGNLDFDEGGEELADAPGNFVDGDSFEPRDAIKGDIARGILYMAVRYDGDDGFADLEPNDSVGNGSAPYMGKLSVLLDWHAQDPPDAAEQARNDAIYTDYQHNRNPFVDRPEFATAIWG